MRRSSTSRCSGSRTPSRQRAHSPAASTAMLPFSSSARPVAARVQHDDGRNGKEEGTEIGKGDRFAKFELAPGFQDAADVDVRTSSPHSARGPFPRICSPEPPAPGQPDNHRGPASPCQRARPRQPAASRPRARPTPPTAASPSPAPAPSPRATRRNAETPRLTRGSVADLVGHHGFEPWTSCLSSMRSNQLS